ncbi:peptidylprolyl isomerase, partial [[Clostridium] symbiosum]|nr:peptidylprolyl isomerase [[Clostridium] symbiosum]
LPSPCQKPHRLRPGVVTEGLDVVDKIAAMRTDWNDRPMKEQKIKKMTAETFGTEYPEPEKC